MIPEQIALLKKAQDSLQAAKLLLDNHLYDISASRAYYTMFYVAEAFLLGDGLAFSSHAAVISALGRDFARTGRIPVEFHRYLIDAQNKRNQADYDINTEITESQANEQINRAEEFLKLGETQL
ncbi:HEPN domain-containing protein [Laspinema olomoucense]|uniref:HEPN domain-containing protein n=1 Tax=Laspinema olomoucense D3b TaxID=2953688 RepID=A0ABT2NAQ4_9CYAN|nr:MULTISPECIES: HEPN domain-containing protein [unclassified Laspinema]MCT7971873.1 HEPN domain-containing protein [Laspinema sp. D3d]MCT7979781.1 HEPN domain-containing protein [Laspinema sp. D3b]MCT7990630.1 HEPN domain-containing protein [Laspinema sp. D3a]MCT7993484.1 HEPN domain-containing protein [Laspinema sp. D3c]